MIKISTQNHANTFRTGKDKPGVNSRLFWESKASEYPLPFEEKTFSRTSRVIDFIAEKGILSEGIKVLDIGCGTGAFALPLAQRRASVTALDISHNMLKQLTGEAKRRHLDFVRPLRSSWKEIDVRKTGLEGAFDIVLSAFSTAIETEEDLLKMERCSTQWCLCIASGRVCHAALYEQLLRAFDAPLNPRPDIRNIKRKLTKIGRIYLFKTLTITITEKRSLREIAKQIVNRLEAAGKNPDPESIYATVESMCGTYAEENNMVEFHRSVDIGVLMWRVDGKQI